MMRSYQETESSGSKLALLSLIFLLSPVQTYGDTLQIPDIGNFPVLAEVTIIERDLDKNTEVRSDLSGVMKTGANNGIFFEAPANSVFPKTPLSLKGTAPSVAINIGTALRWFVHMWNLDNSLSVTDGFKSVPMRFVFIESFYTNQMTGAKLLVSSQKFVAVGEWIFDFKDFLPVLDRYLPRSSNGRHTDDTQMLVALMKDSANNGRPALSALPMKSFGLKVRPIQASCRKMFAGS